VFLQAEGTGVELTMKRGEAEHRVELKLRNLL
jgi:hypothetical protein